MEELISSVSDASANARKVGNRLKISDLAYEVLSR